MAEDSAVEFCTATSVASPQVAFGRQLRGEGISTTREECGRSAPSPKNLVDALTPQIALIPAKPQLEYNIATPRYEVDASSPDVAVDGTMHQSGLCNAIPFSVIYFAAGALSTFILSWGIIRAMSGSAGPSVLAAGGSQTESSALRAEIQLLAEKVAQLAEKSLVAPEPGMYPGQEAVRMFCVGALTMLTGAALCFFVVGERSSFNSGAHLKESASQKVAALERKLDALLESLQGLKPQQCCKDSAHSLKPQQSGKDASETSVAENAESQVESQEQQDEAMIVKTRALTWKLDDGQNQVCTKLRFVYRVEWDVSEKDFTTFKWGEFLESSEFRLGTDHGLRLRFIPRGGAADGCCRLALVTPRRLGELQCRLYTDARSEVGCPAECGETTYIWAQIPANEKQLYSVLAVELLKPEGFTTL